MMLNSDHHGNRIDRLETGFSGLATDFASVKAEMRGLNSGMTSIIDKIDAQDRARPGVSSILPWLVAMLAILTLLGGAIAAPQLQHISRIDDDVHQQAAIVSQMRVDNAVTRDRQDRGVAQMKVDEEQAREDFRR